MIQNQRKTIYNTEYFQPNSTRWNVMKELANFGLVTILCKTILAPLERYRIIKQTQQAYPLKTVKISNFFNFLVKTPSTQGILSLWRSNMIHCWIYFYQVLMQASLFDCLVRMRKQFVENNQQSLSLRFIYQKLAFPFLASVTSLTIIHPLDTYRVHYAMSSFKNKQDAHFKNFRQLKRNIGFKTLYQGFFAGTLISLINFNFLVHAAPIMEDLSTETSYTENVLSGAALLLIYPLDTIKKYLQFNNMHRPAIYSGYKDLFASNDWSLSLLYRGVSAALMRSIFYMPLQLFVLRSFITFRNQDQNQIS